MKVEIAPNNAIQTIEINQESDSRSLEEKQSDLDAAEKDLQKLLDEDVYSQEGLQIELDKLKEKYQLKKMSLQQKGEKWEINGEINPQFVKYANEVTILSKQDISDFDASNLQVFFRVISLKELKNILNSDLIQPRSNPDGSQKGEFGITSNSEYCIQNIIYGNTNKNKKGKMPVNNAAKAKYAIMLEIIVEPNTQEKLRDEFGIQAPGQTSHELTDSLPTAEEAGSSNVIEMKVERVPTGGEPIHNVNYMFKSSNPSIEDPSNPLYVFNQSIIEVRIVGGIIPEGEVDFFNL